MKVCLLGLLSLSIAGVCWSSPECQWNGVYMNSACQCYEGFTGTHCDHDCGCEGHGVCKSDGSCECEAGWKWSASTHRCVWDCDCQGGVQCIGPGECGCEHTCKWGACRNGQCVCYEGYKGDDCSHYDKNIMMNKDVYIGMNIGGISYYSSEVKWVDVSKQSQEWLTEREGGHEWDTHEHDSVQWRPDGYPARLEKGLKLLKLFYRGFGSEEERGNYTILYDGEGQIKFSLTDLHVLYNGKGRKVINFSNIGNGGIILNLLATNPSNPIRNIRILPPGYENTYQRFPFHPLLTEFLGRFSEIRFMDYLSTNNHQPEPTTWNSRRPVDFHTQEGRQGGSIEYLVQLANTVGANPWVCMPHAADDNYLKQFAAYVKQHLRPDLHVYVEYSNEVWNGIFRQTKYQTEQGKPLFPNDPAFKQGMKHFNKRATEVANIWDQVWGSSANRLTNVYAWQTGYQDYYRQALVDLGDRKSSFDALAITGYFDCDQAAGKRHASELPNMTMAQIQNLCNSDLQKQKDSYSHYMDVAKSHGLKLVMYEGGPSVMENGAIVNGAHVQAVTDKAIAFNKDPAIEQPMKDILQGWHDIVTSNGSNAYPGGLFNYFASTGSPSKYGSWGMSEYTGQDLSTVAKWRAVQTYISDHYPNTPLGPKCSFVKNQKTNTAYGCFSSGGHYVCAKSSDNGRSWMNLPSVHQGNHDHLTLDGYDVKAKKLYVRVTDRTDVNTYRVFDEHSQQWAKMTNFQYFSEELAPTVLPRMPTGAEHGLSSHQNC
ncbi:hypothetical protein V1264_023919 [Littorina saxatilis]|uniref:EGF-like domain-containing protein n=2 Tax=Littorina saxatilis TaxID=31220 RepID=A0AAN9GB39_9CAEN